MELRALLLFHYLNLFIKLIEEILENNFIFNLFRQLQQKLEELKDYQALSDEFIVLTSKIDLEKSSSQRKAYTKRVYEDFIKNSKSNSKSLQLSVTH